MSRTQVLLNFAHGEAHLSVDKDQVMSDIPEATTASPSPDSPARFLADRRAQRGLSVRLEWTQPQG